VLVIPAIDVRGGRCVRLAQGDFDRERIYDDDPGRVARALIDAGARRLHIVDLDSARGRPDPDSTAAAQRAVALAAAEGVTVEIGGGVREVAGAEHWIAMGASLVVLGSLAVRDPGAAEALCVALPLRCLAALDVRGGVAQAEGWTVGAGAVDHHLRRWAGWPLAGVIHTEVSRDGMLSGPDLEALRRVVRAASVPVLASGGVSSIDDLVRLEEAGAAGAIVGRAIYEGRLDVGAALRRFPHRAGGDGVESGGGGSR